ncbi:MAG TPA: Gfo/Idh/MocA family oxidoreductase [Bacillota bacterium]|nr:Gfo/Idh/MocA family oxidoreductase [Bacillota bacterium]
MKVAVIGTGRWGKNLVKTLHQLGVLAAVVDQSEILCQTIKHDYPELKVYPDYRQIFTSNIKAVVIATPAPTHYQLVKEALLAGKDVFVEKPMTLSTVEAEELAALAEKAQRVLMVGHLLLYQSAIQWIKEYLDSGRLGELNSLHQERLSLGRARETENVLWDLGVHDLAVILYLTGTRPLSGRISGQQRLRQGIEDDIYLHLIFDNNVQAHLHTSWLWPQRHRQLTITGSQGMLVYNEIEQTVTLYRNGINKSDLSNWDEGAELVFKGEGVPLTREMEHFLECIKERKAPLSDGRSGADVIRVLENASLQLQP